MYKIHAALIYKYKNVFYKWYFLHKVDLRTIYNIDFNFYIIICSSFPILVLNISLSCFFCKKMLFQIEIIHSFFCNKEFL